MDPEVVEIKLSALIAQSSDPKKLKQKEVQTISVFFPPRIYDFFYFILFSHFCLVLIG